MLRTPSRGMTALTYFNAYSSFRKLAKLFDEAYWPIDHSPKYVATHSFNFAKNKYVLLRILSGSSLLGRKNRQQMEVP